MSEFPTVSDELHRKTLDALAWLADQREAGDVSEREFYTAIRTLFIAVSGMVPTDVIEMLSMEEPELTDRALILMREGDPQAVVISPLVKEMGYGIFTNDSRKPFVAKSKSLVIGSEEGDRWLHNTLGKFKEKGFHHL